MTHETWELFGFCISSNDDLLCIPIFQFRSTSKKQYFAQYTFSSASDYFELTEVEIDNVVMRRTKAPANPKEVFYYGLLVNEKCTLVERRFISKALSIIDVDNLSSPAQIQYSEILRASNSDFNIAPSTPNDTSFQATLSAQKFVDSAITKMSVSAQVSQTVRKILWCSRWVTNWNIDNVPDHYLGLLLSDLTVSRNELQNDLSIAKHEERSAFKDAPEELQTGQVSQALQKLGGLKRQELRLSGLIKHILDNPRQGRDVALQYEPRTKYEALVLPLVQQIAFDNLNSDPVQREMRIAQLIPKIYRKYFPIRRGRFLVDFIRDLSGYRHVKEQLVDIYKEKRGTYGVGLYKNVIDQLLQDG